jgi:hypothetical protein
MSVGEVAEGLREVLNDVANKILELQPRTELIKRVRVQQTDLSKRPNALNESEVISLIKNTLLDLNK